MPAISNSYEVRILRLETDLAILKAKLASLADKAGQAYEDNSRQEYNFPQPVIFDAMTTSVVAARDGDTLGQGLAKFLAADEDGNLSDPGYPAITAWNNTGGAIAPDVRGYVALVAGLWRFIEADCSGAP